MTREEAKELLPIIQAYAEGKVIQYRNKGRSTWHNTTTWYDLDCDEFNFDCDMHHYRIKPKLKYRPFKNQEECWNEMLKHQPFGWVKEISSEILYLINSILDSGIAIMEDVDIFEEAINSYEFKDGTPFGIKEE